MLAGSPSINCASAAKISSGLAAAEKYIKISGISRFSNTRARSLSKVDLLKRKPQRDTQRWQPPIRELLLDIVINNAGVLSKTNPLDGNAIEALKTEKEGALERRAEQARARAESEAAAARKQGQESQRLVEHRRRLMEVLAPTLPLPTLSLVTFTAAEGDASEMRLVLTNNPERCPPLIRSQS